jgi:hypothetical protein
MTFAVLSPILPQWAVSELLQHADDLQEESAVLVDRHYITSTTLAR